MQQRPNVGNMLFLAAFWFFMSSNNPAPPMIVVGPDGEVVPRLTTLDRARARVEEYAFFLNGTTPEGHGGEDGHNGTEVSVWADPRTAVQPSAITPSRYQHDPSSDFYRNITGFYREAQTHVVDLLKPPMVGQEGFWHHVRFPTINSTEAEGGRYNETLAREMRGDFDWYGVDKWDMNLRERVLKDDKDDRKQEETTGWYEDMASQVVWKDWAWVKGTATLYAHSDPATTIPPSSTDANDTIVYDEDSVNYDFVGLHYLPAGSYALFGMPEGRTIDLRNVPRLFTDRHEAPSSGHASHGALLNASRVIVMRELKADLKEAEESLLLSDVPSEGTLDLPRLFPASDTEEKLISR